MFKKLSIIFSLVSIFSLTFGGAVLAEENAAIDNNKNTITAEVRDMPSPNLNFKIQDGTNTSYNGGKLDFVNTLGLKPSATPELVVKIGDHWRVSYSQFSSSGSKVITDELNFNDQKFAANSNVNTKLDFNYGRLTWMNNLTKPKADSKLYWMVDIKSFTMSAKMNGTDSVTGLPVSSSKSYSIPVPTLGIGISGILDKAGRMEGYAEISGLAVGGVNIYDLEAGIKYAFAPNFGLQIGYRNYGLNYDSGNNKNGNFEVDGLQVGFQYRF